MTVFERLTGIGRKPLELLRGLPARIGGVMLLGTVLLVSMSTSAEAALPKARCDVASAVAPAADLVVGNLLGFADKYGLYLIIAAICLVALTAMTKHSNRFMGMAFKVVVALLILSIIGTLLGKLFHSPC